MSRARLRALYGAGVGNLLALLLCFAIAGFAVVGWFQRPRDVTTVIEWFAAAVVLHDLVAVPLYTLLDRIVFGSLRRVGGHGHRGGRTIVGAVNATPYLRVPAILSGLLLVVFFPVIFGLGSRAELTASGIAEQGYLAKWLIATAVMFALSGVIWAVAMAVGRGRAGVAAGAGAGAAPGRGTPRAGVPPVPDAVGPVDEGAPGSAPDVDPPAPGGDSTLPRGG